MNREQRRAAAKAARKARAQGDEQEEFNQALRMFSEMPTECLHCEAPFDGKNPDQVASWYVVVHDDHTNLYCPPCWQRGREMADNIAEGQETK